MTDGIWMAKSCYTILINLFITTDIIYTSAYQIEQIGIILRIYTAQKN